ncbi:hypothetical protein Trydic_g2440 [Trypoxylus dichotomus]
MRPMSLLLFLSSFSVNQISGFPLKKDEIDLGRYGNANFLEPSLETGKRVSEWNEKSQVNPEELGEYLEGDVLFQGGGKNGLVDLSYRWKDGVVPYVIKGPYKEDDLKAVFNAMDQYHKNTCIRFRRKNANDTDYIRIQNTKTGCWSSVGRIGGEQNLNLQSPGCLSTLGTPIHELMHALGFHHEQTRSDRDDYVTILWENITPGRESNFEKSENGTTTPFGIEYDYGSVMHYSKYAFSKNKKPTIEPKHPDVKIGQRDGFSKGDLVKLNEMYNCSSVDLNSITTELPIYTTPGTTIIDSISEIVNMILG